ncbi:hypothetical protein OROMI_025110 [Orobanche minor]
MAKLPFERSYLRSPPQLILLDLHQPVINTPRKTNIMVPLHSLIVTSPKIRMISHVIPSRSLRIRIIRFASLPKRRPGLIPQGPNSRANRIRIFSPIKSLRHLHNPTTKNFRLGFYPVILHQVSQLVIVIGFVIIRLVNIFLEPANFQIGIIRFSCHVFCEQLEGGRVGGNVFDLTEEFPDYTGGYVRGLVGLVHEIRIFFDA